MFCADPIDITVLHTWITSKINFERSIVVKTFPNFFIGCTKIWIKCCKTGAFILKGNTCRFFSGYWANEVILPNQSFACLNSKTFNLEVCYESYSRNVLKEIGIICNITDAFFLSYKTFIILTLFRLNLLHNFCVCVSNKIVFIIFNYYQ